MDEMINAIAAAEAKAADIKNEAVIKAGKIIEDARAQAAELEKASALARAKMRDDTIKAATLKADKEYAAYISSCERQSKEYAEDVSKNTDVIVGKIVGRVSGGNC
jgi:vacuolar-type H+-ATPase subunit H